MPHKAILKWGYKNIKNDHKHILLWKVKILVFFYYRLLATNEFFAT